MDSADGADTHPHRLYYDGENRPTSSTHLTGLIRRVYTALRERILRGELEPGEKLPRYLELAVEFGVAPMTVRQVLGHLEEEGLVLRRPGRGTFVRESATAAVLVVEDDPVRRAVLCEDVERAGYRAVAAENPPAALALLASDATIALILSAMRLREATDGAAFIRAARRRRPDLPLAALLACPQDLVELWGIPECPVFILSTPPRPRQLDEVLRLALAK